MPEKTTSDQLLASTACWTAGARTEESAREDRLFNLDEVTRLAAPGSWMGFDIINGEMLTSPWTRPWVEMQTQSGAPWIGTLDDPVGFLARRGWKATRSQAGDKDADFGRWPDMAIPNTMPGVPHKWYVTAQKQDFWASCATASQLSSKGPGRYRVIDLLYAPPRVFNCPLDRLCLLEQSSDLPDSCPMPSFGQLVSFYHFTIALGCSKQVCAFGPSSRTRKRRKNARPIKKNDGYAQVRQFCIDHVTTGKSPVEAALTLPVVTNIHVRPGVVLARVTYKAAGSGSAAIRRRRLQG